MTKGQSARGIVTFELTKGLKRGLVIGFGQAILQLPDMPKVPNLIRNWHFCRGAVAPFALCSTQVTSLVGTAIFVAPGFAVMATHTFIDKMGEIENGHLVPQCFGIREKSLDIWQATRINICENDDVAFLSMEPISQFPDDGHFYTLGITTRTPIVGEDLHIIGFRGAENIGMNKENFLASLLVSRGVVKNVFHYGRDKFLCNYPGIEIGCGSLGGMSGGACLDKNGLLVGLISSGMQSPDMEGPTYVSKIVTAFGRSISLTWPPAVYSDPIRPIDIKPPLIHIDRPDSVRVVSEGTVEYMIWH